MSNNPNAEPALTVDRCTDSSTWDRFVVRSDGPPFALSGWGDACETYGHDCLYLTVCDSDRIVAVLALTHLESYLFGSKLVSPAFGEYGSVLKTEATTEASIQALLRRATSLADKLSVDFVSLRGHEIDADMSLSKQSRFVTFQVVLDRDVDAIWDDIKESRQRQIRQARDDDSLDYIQGDSVGDLEAYYQLHLATMRGHGTPPHSFEFFRTLWDQFSNDERFHLGLVLKDEQPINGIINFTQGSTAHQWGVVSDYEYRDLNGGSLALWKSLQWAANNGYDTYDFGRTREGTGVYMFKKSFGGVKTWYDDYHYFPDGDGTLPHPEDDKYDHLKRVWQRLPISVTRAIGPQIRKKVSL